MKLEYIGIVFYPVLIQKYQEQTIGVPISLGLIFTFCLKNIFDLFQAWKFDGVKSGGSVGAQSRLFLLFSFQESAQN